ncbi:MAG: hypothetical protein WAO12_06015 [Venatoribacter sp.]
MINSSLKAKYHPISKISVVDVYQMYSIYSKYYMNTKWRIFLSDLSKKSGVFIIRRKDNKKIVGFSTVVNYPIFHEGKKSLGVFSGDTIIEREYWGSRVLQMAFYKYMVTLKILNPFQDLYWLLISKGFKTYLLMSNNVDKYFPSVDNNSPELAPIVDNYCQALFHEYYDSKQRILDFGDHYQCLKDGVAEIDENLAHSNDKISFFEQMNPEWRRGTELPCVGLISWSLIFGYVKKYLNKPTSKGRLDAQSSSQAASAPVAELDLSFESRRSA